MSVPACMSPANSVFLSLVRRMQIRINATDGEKKPEPGPNS
jgi:hypothetical protein